MTERDGADVMSSGRVFQSLGTAAVNDRSPTDASLEGTLLRTVYQAHWRYYDYAVYKFANYLLGECRRYWLLKQNVGSAGRK